MKCFMQIVVVVLLSLASVALAEDRQSISVVRDDDGTAEARCNVSSPSSACMKTLTVEVDPKALTQARIMYYMYNDPYDMATKTTYGAPVEGVKWSNLVVSVNGREVLRDSLIKHTTKGWHEIPVDPALLVQGENKIVMALDAMGSYFYLGVDRSAPHGCSAYSSDGGKTFTTNWLGTIVDRNLPDPGEYMVRLKVSMASAALAGDRQRITVVGDDDGTAEARCNVSSPSSVCMKVLTVKAAPKALTQARIMYYMYNDPYDMATKTTYGAPVEGVKWSDFVVSVNGREVLRDSLIKHTTKGWHEIPVDPALLVQGENKIVMALDAMGSYFYLGVDRSAPHGCSAYSSDGGKTFTTNWLGTIVDRNLPDPGEYMVRLKLWTAETPEVGFTERNGRYYGWLEVEDLFSTTRTHPQGFRALGYATGINQPSGDLVAYALVGSFETPFDLPADGEWRLWLRGWMDGFRDGAFTLTWDGKPFYASAGKHEFTSDAKLRFDWLDLGGLQLTKGRHVLGVTTTGDCGHMFDVLVLTTDTAYRPDVNKPLPRMTQIEKLVPPEGLAALQPGLYMTENPIPWAKPLAGGPLRTLWVCGGINEREIVELQQRMDMTADVVSSDMEYYGNSVFGSNLNLDQGDLLYGLLAGNKSYDVMVLVRTKLDQIPDQAMAELLRRVEQGMGLIIVQSQRNDEKETKLSALLKEVKTLDLPGFKAALDLNYQKYVSWREYGKGRILVKPYCGWGTVDHLRLSPDDLRYPFWEYQFGHWVKLLERAGRRDVARFASVAVPEALPPGRQAVLTITTEGAEGTQVAGIVWAPNQPKWTKWGPAPCAGGATVKLPVGMEDGLYHVEANLLNARGEVVDSAVTFYRVDQPARVAEMKAEYAAEGSGQAVVTLKTANTGAATKLPARLEVWGARERMLGANDLTIEFAAGAGELKVSMPVMPSWERLLEARLVICPAGQSPLQRANRLFLRSQKVALDDFTSVTVNHENQEAPTYTWPVYSRLSDDMGMKADYPGSIFLSSLESGKASAVIFSMTNIGTPTTGPGGERIPCLHDPQTWVKEEPAIRQLAGPRYAPYSPLVLGLGDEMTINLDNHEVCFSKYTLAAFRESLQRQYGTIQKLNATWQTQFADWDAIIPWQIPQARQRPENIAPWLEFRVFMTRTFVESLVKMQKWVKEAAPGAYTGGANPLDESYTSCAIFSQIYPALEYAQIYPRFHDRARSWFRDPRLVGMWSGYGYDRATTEYHAWLLPAYSGTLMCWFGAGRSYDYRTLTNTLGLGEPGRSIQGANLELQSGIGKLLIAADMEQEPVAILSAYRSKYAYTALKASKAPTISATGWDQEFDLFLSGCSDLLRKLRVPYKFVDEDQVERGELDHYQMLIAPQASVLSEGAVQKLLAFARQHPVVADQNLGTYDEHGCKRAAAPFNFAQLGGLKLSDFGDQPLRSTNENLARLRQVVAAAGIQPCQEVAGGDINFIVRKRLGDASLLVVFGHGALVVKPPAGTVAYDARTHKLLGTGTTTLTQERSPAVLVFAPQKVAGVTLTATPAVQRGKQATFDVQMQPGVMTVVRLAATGPDGKPRPWYDANVTIKSGKGSATFRPALNDAAGEWRFVATDIISGITAEAKVSVRE